MKQGRIVASEHGVDEHILAGEPMVRPFRDNRKFLVSGSEIVPEPRWPSARNAT